MAIYLTNRDGGKTDEAGHYQFLAAGFNGNVLKGLTLVQTNPLGMKLNLTAGNARIPYGGYAYSAYVQEGETEEVQIGTANPSNPRIDRVVMYIDRAMARQTVNPNNPGIAKIAVVAGTPAGTPVRPSDVSVNAAVGNNPWIDLADVRVNTGVTQITTANVTDKRVMASAVLGPNAVTADNIDFTTFPRFMLQRNADMTLSTGQNLIKYDTIKNNNYIGSYNTSTGEYTVPVKGFYVFFARLSAIARIRLFLTLQVNSVDVARGIDYSNDATPGSSSNIAYGPIELSAGDKVKMLYYASASSAIETDIKAYFSGFMQSI